MAAAGGAAGEAPCYDCALLCGSVVFDNSLLSALLLLMCLLSRCAVLAAHCLVYTRAPHNFK